MTPDNNPDTINLTAQLCNIERKLGEVAGSINCIKTVSNEINKATLDLYDKLSDQRMDIEGAKLQIAQIIAEKRGGQTVRSMICGAVGAILPIIVYAIIAIVNSGNTTGGML